jgi:rRNA maturation RNase YbeY
VGTRVRVVIETEDPISPLSWGDVLDVVGRVLERPIQPCTVIFVSPDRSLELNRTYRKENCPTNILSFPEFREIVICPSIVSVEANQKNVLEKNWMTQLVVHGILHLEGYRHGTENEEKVMQALEQRALSYLFNGS